MRLSKHSGSGCQDKALKLKHREIVGALGLAGVVQLVSSAVCA
jgi:hypothetical protein